MKRGLPQVMVMVGYRSRGKGLRSVAHRAGLVLTAALAVLIGWIALATHAELAARHARILAREPVSFTAGSGKVPVAYWLPHSDHLHDRQFLTVYIAPLRPDVPPPPGLPAWPAPGTAVMSPALAAADSGGVLHQRYGSIVGTIGRTGLADPGEWLVYLRPRDNADFDHYGPDALISGFGRAPGSRDLRMVVADGYPGSDLYRLIMLTLVLPLVVLMFVAVRGTAEQRDRRVALLEALGASRTATAWLLLGEAAVPIFCGAAIGSACALLTIHVTMRVPVTGYQVVAADLVGLRPWIAVLFAVGVGVTLLALCLSHLWRGTRTTRPTVVARSRGRWAALLSAAGLATCVWSSYQAGLSGGVHGRNPLILVFFVALLVALATLPAAVAIAIVVLGKLSGGLGRRLGWVSALVGGRWLAARPSGIARVGAVAVVGLGVLAILQIWVSQHQEAGASSPVRRVIGERVVTVMTSTVGPDADAFVAAVGADRTLRVGEDDQGRVSLTGDCAALARIGTLPECPTTPASASVAYRSLTPIGVALDRLNASILVSGDPMVSQTQGTGYAAVGFVVFNDAGTTGVDAIAVAAYHLLIMPQVSDPGQYGAAGRLANTQAYQWILILSAAGVLVLVFAALLAAIDAMFAQAVGIGVLGSVAGSRRLYFGITGWSVAFPLLIATVFGAGIAALLGSLLIRLSGSGSVSAPLLTAATAVVGLVGVAQAAFCGEAITRSVRRWRPTAD